MNISKQAVLEIIEKDKNISMFDRTNLYRKISELPSISDGWISVEAGDFVVFEYYTETKCVIDKGIVIWITDNECCVETGIYKKKRHQMEVSALRRKLIDLPPAPTK